MLFRHHHLSRAYRWFPGGIVVVGSGAVLLLHHSTSDPSRTEQVEEHRAPGPATAVPRDDPPQGRTGTATNHHHRKGGGEIPMEFRPLLRQHDYPAWNYDWDCRQEPGNKWKKPKLASCRSSSSATTTTRTTRHILLIRHGQYEQQYDTDEQQVLTPLGRRQATYTGERLAKMMHLAAAAAAAGGEENDANPPPTCRLVGLHVSGMKRAQETADIIADHLSLLRSSRPDNNNNHHNNLAAGLVRSPPDELLNEGFPAPIIPVRDDLGTLSSQVAAITQSADRIEGAFQKYIHRARPDSTNNVDHDEDDDAVVHKAGDGDDDDTKVTKEMDTHEFEIIVCHANVIRYLLLRALQLPPEAWLRLSLFNCSISYIMVQPNGTVSVRLIGDTGHIPYHDTTFSGSYGYNWKTPGST